MSTERDFAAGMRILRTAAGMSQARLASLLAQYGIQIDSTAVTRTENASGADKPRLIRLDEAVAIAKVFDRSVEQVCHVGNPSAYSAEQAPTVPPAEDAVKIAADLLRRMADQLISERSTIQTNRDGVQ